MVARAAVVPITARGRVAALAAAGFDVRDGQPLNDAVAGEHPTVDREVAAHHKGTHGGVLLRQEIRFVREIRLVLPAVHEDQAREATSITVALV